MKQIFLYILLFISLSVSSQTIRPIGSGSGNLTINKTNYTINDGDTIELVAGTYGDIYVDLQCADGHTITIRNQNSGTGLVQATGSFGFNDPTNLFVTGNHKPGLTQGIYIHDISGRASQIDFTSKCARNVTLQYIKYKNISDYTIYNSYTDYSAADSIHTSPANININHCYFDNAGTINLDGGFDVTGPTNQGLIRHLFVYNNEFHNTSTGTALAVYNVQGGSFHDNFLDTINTTNDDHNGIFLIQGYVDSFYNNKILFHQGNLCRFWPFTITTGSTKANCYIYNNIVWNSRKYSAFEFQTFDYNIATSKSVSVDMHLWNNTAGKLNTSHDFSAGILDYYDMRGGVSEIKNNFVYDNYFEVFAGTDSIINYEDDAGGSDVISNNKHYNTFAQTGLIDTSGFYPGGSSPLIGAGTHIAALMIDYYGATRSNPPTVGAVEPAGGMTQLDPPTLSHASVTTTTATLNWTSVTSTTNYIVQQSTASDYSGATQIYSGSGLTFNVTGLSASTHYYFRVKAQASGFTDSNYGTDNFTTSSSGTSSLKNYFIIQPKIIKK